VTRALVTGAAGFIGANLARRLLADGHDVHLLDRPGSRHWRLEELLDDVTLHGADLEDADAVTRTIEAARPEWIFHLAARGAYSWQGDLREILRVNVVGTANLLEAATRQGFAALVYSGTSSEYGFKDHAPTEDEDVVPNSAYAVAKVAATNLCRLFARNTGNRVVALRLYSTFGPWEEPGRLLPNLIMRGLQGELPPLVSPEAAHDFVSVDDVVEAFVLSATATEVEPGAIFNVGTGIQTTLAEAVASVRALLGVEVEPQWGTMPAKEWDTGVWVADSRRIERQLGWTPADTFADGLRKQVEWFRGKEQLWPLYEKLAAQRAARKRSAR
jgi:dolichol-phosphate mannosyltransferase